jgi:hypothetical protein
MRFFAGEGMVVRDIARHLNLVGDKGRARTLFKTNKCSLNTFITQMNYK